MYFADTAPEMPSISIELRSGGEAITMETASGSVRTRVGAPVHPDTVLIGAPHLILGLLSGKMELGAACAAGLNYEGDPDAIKRIRPKSQRAS